jgi:hypothetical protein
MQTNTVAAPTDTDAFHHRHHEPAAWRVDAWRRQVPISRSKFYQERNAGRIKTVKVGSSTLVTTAPKDYLAALAGVGLPA